LSTPSLEIRKIFFGTAFAEESCCNPMVSKDLRFAGGQIFDVSLYSQKVYEKSPGFETEAFKCLVMATGD
jgi:hypothetical protein